MSSPASRFLNHLRKKPAASVSTATSPDHELPSGTKTMDKPPRTPLIATPASSRRAEGVEKRKLERPVSHDPRSSVLALYMDSPHGDIENPASTEAVVNVIHSTPPPTTPPPLPQAGERKRYRKSTFPMALAAKPTIDETREGDPWWKSVGLDSYTSSTVPSAFTTAKEESTSTTKADALSLKLPAVSLPTSTPSSADHNPSLLEDILGSLPAPTTLMLTTPTTTPLTSPTQVPLPLPLSAKQNDLVSSLKKEGSNQRKEGLRVQFSGQNQWIEPERVHDPLEDEFGEDQEEEEEEEVASEDEDALPPLHALDLSTPPTALTSVSAPRLEVEDDAADILEKKNRKETEEELLDMKVLKALPSLPQISNASTATPSNPPVKRVRRRHIQIQARPVEWRTVGVQVGASRQSMLLVHPLSMSGHETLDQARLQNQMAEMQAGFERQMTEMQSYIQQLVQEKQQLALALEQFKQQRDIV